MEKVVSLKTVISKVYRDVGENRELNFDDCVEWIGDALLHIGVFKQFKPKVLKLDIEGGRAKLPCDFYKLIYVTYQGIPMSWASNAMNTAYFCDDCKIPECCTDNTFYVNDNFVFTSFAEGEICMEYLSIPTDEEGFPTVPDQIDFLDACKFFVIKTLDWQDWRRGIIPDKVMQDSEMRWNDKVNAAKASGNMPNPHELERLKSTWQRLVPLNNEFMNGFRNLGKQERKYLQ